MIFNVIAKSMTDDSILIDVQDLGGAPIQVDDGLGLIKDERRLVKTVDYCRGPITDGSFDPHNGNPADAITFSAVPQHPNAAVELLHRCRLTIASAIEREVQFQDIHTGLAEKPSPSRPRVGVDDGAHGVCTDATGLGHAINLNLGRTRG